MTKMPPESKMSDKALEAIMDALPDELTGLDIAALICMILDKYDLSIGQAHGMLLHVIAAYEPSEVAA
jgi:hypothetical protein